MGPKGPQMGKYDGQFLVTTGTWYIGTRIDYGSQTNVTHGTVALSSKLCSERDQMSRTYIAHLHFPCCSRRLYRICGMLLVSEIKKGGLRLGAYFSEFSSTHAYPTPTLGVHRDVILTLVE
jgi:hypothetical protein